MVEPIAAQFGTMINFIDKIDTVDNKVNFDIWPDMGKDFVLNKFYRNFDGGEGWIGKSYIIFWSRSEIKYFNLINQEFFSEKFIFFSSNGGGTQFGFIKNINPVFFSLPDIGDESDIYLIGSFDDLLKNISTADYI